MNLTALPFQGKSMNPLFASAQQIYVDFLDCQNLKVGDVLLYKDQNGEWLCHRLVHVDADFYVLKGDANTSAEVMKSPTVFGKVKAMECKGKDHFFPDSRLMILSCRLQYLEVQSQIWFLKKLYRYSSLLLLRFFKFFIMK